MEGRKGLEEKELLESFFLCSIKGLGAVSIEKLLDRAETAGKVWELPEETVKKLLGEKRAQLFFQGREKERRKVLEDRFFKMKERGIFFLPRWHEDYPARLKRIPGAPAALYGKGRLPEEEKKAVAVIGARECSVYGREATRYFASGLAREGISVVSGMARGVDGIAGLAALEQGGHSVAVLGCGVDICYPPENRMLYERLEREGCLISEYPPGTRPDARLFPPRNRIISGMSDLVLVTEAREKSGTLITVDMALEQGKDVFAVPGRITDSCSRGCNRLIGSGAGIAVSVWQLLREVEGRTAAAGVKELRTEPSGPEKKTAAALQEAEGAKGNQDKNALRSRVLAALDCDPRSLDEILCMVEKEGWEITMGELMQELMQLCMEQKAGSRRGMFFSLQPSIS